MNEQERLGFVRNYWTATGRELPAGHRPMSRDEYVKLVGPTASPDHDQDFLDQAFYSFDDERTAAELASALIRTIPKDERVEGEVIPVPCPTCLSERRWTLSAGRISSRCYVCTARSARERRQYLKSLRDR